MRRAPLMLSLALASLSRLGERTPGARSATRRGRILSVARDLGRIAIAAGCAAFGAHPDSLALGAVLMLARAWTVSVAGWGRDHLSWAPRRSRHVRLTGTGTVGREVPKSWR